MVSSENEGCTGDTVFFKSCNLYSETVSYFKIYDMTVPCGDCLFSPTSFFQLLNVITGIEEESYFQQQVK